MTCNIPVVMYNIRSYCPSEDVFGRNMKIIPLKRYQIARTAFLLKCSVTLDALKLGSSNSALTQTKANANIGNSKSYVLIHAKITAVTPVNTPIIAIIFANNK
eukprot:NODE_691_length_4696_cov_0.623885.p6 type:complete len:103 gc:universal NODE_691_length_4696_cov_0.623885:3471-3779(+)